MMKSNGGYRRNDLVVATLFVWFLSVLSGCFILGGNGSHYQSEAVERLETLRDFHLQFIDEFTAAEDKSWDEQALQRQCQEGETKFAEALEYAKNTGDEQRIKAFDLLYKEFRANCDKLKQDAQDGKFFFKPIVAEELTHEIGQNYENAIAGEKKRVDGPLFQ